MSPEDLNEGAQVLGRQIWRVVPYAKKYPKRVATGIFAISNIFAYYYLSLDKYLPVVFSGVFGMLQIVLIVLYHNTILQVVNIQILSMFILLFIQCAFFFFSSLEELKTDDI